MQYETLVSAAAAISSYIVHLDNETKNNPSVVWLEVNEDHPDVECNISLSHVTNDDASYEAFEEYKHAYGPIYQAEFPNEYKEWSAKTGNDESHVGLNETEYYADTIGDMIQEYCTIHSDLWTQLQNLNKLIELYNDEDLEDVYLELIEDTVNYEEGNARPWEAEDFRLNKDEKAICAALTVFKKLAMQDEIDVDTKELRMLARWADGEDMVYIKLEC